MRLLAPTEIAIRLRELSVKRLLYFASRVFHLQN